MTDCDMEDCYADAEYSVQMVGVWGRYCREHVLEAIDEEFDCRVVVGTEISE